MNKQEKQTSLSIDEEQIIQLLETTPVPLSSDYHGRMADMPWMVNKKRGNQQMKQSIAISSRKKLTLGFTLLLVIISVLSVMTPTGRTFAQDMLRFFQRSSEVPSATLPETKPIVLNTQADEGKIEIPEESKVTVETAVTDDNNQSLTITNPENEAVAVEIETDKGTGVIASAANELDLTISDDEEGFTAVTTNSSNEGGGGGGIASNNVALDEASALVGFPVATINALPAGYDLDTVFTPLADTAVPANAVGPTFISLYYRNGVHTILLVQDSKLAADGNVGETIGETAVLQTVDIAPGITAEYVQGIWVMPHTFEPGTDPMLVAEWDNNAPNQRLVWEANSIRYELKSDSPELTMTALVEIAQSIR